MHVFPATANDCILQTNSFGLVNRHIFRPTDKNGTAWFSLLTHFDQFNIMTMMMTLLDGAFLHASYNYISEQSFDHIFHSVLHILWYEV